MPRYIVRLTETERQQLEQMLAKGRHAASTAARARHQPLDDPPGPARNGGRRWISPM